MRLAAGFHSLSERDGPTPYALGSTQRLLEDQTGGGARTARFFHNFSRMERRISSSVTSGFSTPQNPEPLRPPFCTREPAEEARMRRISGVLVGSIAVAARLAGEQSRNCFPRLGQTNPRSFFLRHRRSQGRRGESPYERVGRVGRPKPQPTREVHMDGCFQIRRVASLALVVTLSTIGVPVHANPTTHLS